MPRPVLAAIVCVLGCSAFQPVVDFAPPSDCTAGPEVLPDDPDCAPHPLTGATAGAWLAFAFCSPNANAPALEQQIEAVRGDESVTDALFAVVDATWTFDGTSASCTDALTGQFALNVIRALRDPNALARLNELTWRPLPPHPVELEMLEEASAEALACIDTPDARAAALSISNTHPSLLVRQAVADVFQTNACGFFE